MDDDECVVGEQGVRAAGQGEVVAEVLFRARCYADNDRETVFVEFVRTERPAGDIGIISAA